MWYWGSAHRLLADFFELKGNLRQTPATHLEGFPKQLDLLDKPKTWHPQCYPTTSLMLATSGSVDGPEVCHNLFVQVNTSQKFKTIRISTSFLAYKKRRTFWWRWHICLTNIWPVIFQAKSRRPGFSPSRGEQKMPDTWPALPCWTRRCNQGSWNQTS